MDTAPTVSTKRRLTRAAEPAVRTRPAQVLAWVRQAEREAKRLEQEEKKAALESCKDACREACVNWRTGGVREPCFNRCVALECS